MTTLFCRHNRFTADCPICAKGTVLEGSGRRARPAGSRPVPHAASGTAPKRRAGSPTVSRRYAGPYVSAGPYEREDGTRYEVRLEPVPGGVRLAEWSRGELGRSAPVLPGADLAALVAAARSRELLPAPDLDRLEAAAAAEGDAGPAPFGASPGRSGDMQEELRVEPLGEGTVRVGRWHLRPGTGWQLREAPTMFPAKRYAEALAGAARLGLLRPA